MSTPCFSSPPSPTSNDKIMEESFESAKSIIKRWDLNSSTHPNLPTLFHHAIGSKEAREFLQSVEHLRQAMHVLVTDRKTPSHKLALAQSLMQIAMKRLEKEFYHMLSEICGRLDQESVSSRLSSSDDEYNTGSQEHFEMARDSITDLKSIADCMIRCGYGKECLNMYKLARKFVVHEELGRLGIKSLKSSQVQKLNWEALEHASPNWLNATRVALRSLFVCEKTLCYRVFAASERTRESCFAEITKAEAINLFRFPELFAKTKRSPQKIYQLLQLYQEISKLWPEIESIFSFESTSDVKLQALSSLHKLSKCICDTLSDFEASIQKSSSKTTVFGGGIHPLNKSAMTYISSLASYDGVLSSIIADNLLPRNYSALPESPKSKCSSSSELSVHLAWLILILLCKLDKTADGYKDAALSYLFLTNNLHFVVEKVRTTNLKYLLGDEWISQHAKKVRQYASNYEAMAWCKTFCSLPDTCHKVSPEIAKECFRKFNAAFEEAYRKQLSWTVEDRKLRDELKSSIARKLAPVYHEFYDNNLLNLSGETNLELLVRFSPDDLGNYLSDLFHGTSISGDSSSSSSTSRSSLFPPHQFLLR